MAAYASQSKFTLIGGLRAVGQIIAYELPVVLGAAAVAMLAGSCQHHRDRRGAGRAAFASWPFPFGAIAFVIFLLASFAEVMWNPFDMPVAESEIVTGPYTEYSGMRFIFFYMSEFAHVVVYCCLATMLFFGGWNGPFDFVPPAACFLGKVVRVRRVLHLGAVHAPALPRGPAPEARVEGADPARVC